MNLCPSQQEFIDTHRENCPVCKESYRQYRKNHNIPTHPPCKRFEEQMNDHLSSCVTCKAVNKKWNDNSVPIIPEMRQVAIDIGNNKIPSKENLGKTIKHITKHLGIDIS